MRNDMEYGIHTQTHLSVFVPIQVVNVVNNDPKKTNPVATFVFRLRALFRRLRRCDVAAELT